MNSFLRCCRVLQSCNTTWIVRSRRALATVTYLRNESSWTISTISSDEESFSDAVKECIEKLPPSANRRLLCAFALRSETLEADLGVGGQGEPAGAARADAEPASQRGAQGYEGLRTRRRRLRADLASPQSVVIPAAACDNMLRAGNAVAGPGHEAGSPSSQQASDTAQTMLGCTAGDFCEGASGQSLVLAAVDLPPGVSVEPFTISGSSLPRLAEYSRRIREDNSHFILLCNPSAHPQEITAIAQRLRGIFPRALLAGAMAVTPSLRRVAGADLPRPILFGSGVDVFSTATAVGVALHGLGHGEPVSKFWAALIGSVFSSVEFDGQLPTLLSPTQGANGNGSGMTVAGIDGGTGTIKPQDTMKRLFAVPGLRNGPQAAPRPSSPAAVAHAVLSSTGHSVTAEVAGPFPIFCLDKPLCPHEIMDVRVFEPRYRLMLRQYFTSGTRFTVGLAPALTTCGPGGRSIAADGGNFAGAGKASTQTAAISPASDGLFTYTAVPGETSPVPPAVMSALHEHDISNPSEAGGSSSMPTVATVARVVHVYESTAEGSYLLRLQGERRVRCRGSWVAPRTFGLVHGIGHWLDDVGSTAAGSTAAPADTSHTREAALCESLAGSIDAVWDGQSTAHALLGKVLRNRPQEKGIGASGKDGPSPELLSWQYCSSLPLPSSERQTWLELDRTSDRLARVLDYLHRKLDDLSFRTKERIAKAPVGGAGQTGDVTEQKKEA